MLFVSLQVYASSSTVVDIAGVRLGLTPSPVGGNLQLMYGDSPTGTLQREPLDRSEQFPDEFHRHHLATGLPTGLTLNSN
ncbi:MAG: hypothetical protein HY736_01500 [Verrucomicrobia bacterium]|nr:hypothetical protein [Verrucomicrobiota bacterium]